MNKTAYRDLCDELLDKAAVVRASETTVYVNEFFKVIARDGVFIPCRKGVEKYLTVAGEKVLDAWYYLYTVAGPHEKPNYYGEKTISFLTFAETEQFCIEFTRALQNMGNYC